jgi:uncharacterized protein (DUF58 family)
MLEARAFEPDFLTRLDRLVLVVRRARAERAGQRTLGRVQGSGLEFENFRQYAEGDDLRFLDWNSLARHDELVIRTFRPERELEVTILIDASASMALPDGDDKLGLALALGAALAYVAMSANDAVRLVCFGMRRGAMRLTATEFHRRQESYPGFKTFVAAVRGRGETRLGAAAGELLLERRAKGVVILISDFLVSSLDYEEALTRLVAAGHEVKAVHVMGERESSGTYPPGLYRLRDSETGQFRDVVLGSQVAAACRARAEQIAGRLREFCTAHGISCSPAFGAARFEEIVEREFPKLGVLR